MLLSGLHSRAGETNFTLAQLPGDGTLSDHKWRWSQQNLSFGNG